MVKIPPDDRLGHKTLSTMQTQIQGNEILAFEDGRIVGKIEFSLQDSMLSILHTYAYLMQAALAFAEERHYTVLPVCSFAQEYMRKKGLNR